MSTQPLVQLETFKRGFQVSDLISGLSQQVLDQHGSTKAKPSPSKTAAPRTAQQTASADSLALLDQLLAQFER